MQQSFLLAEITQNEISAYTAIALAVLVGIAGILTWIFARKYMKIYVACAVAVTLIFAVTVIALNFEAFESTSQIWLTVCLFVPLLSAVLLAVFKREWLKHYLYAVIAVATVFGVSWIVNDFWKYTAWDALWVSLIFSLIPIAIVAVHKVFAQKKEKTDVKSIVYAGVCIALSFALSYIRIFHLPQGGSVTIASLVPVMLYAYMFGFKKGLMVGLIYGMLQAIQDPFIVHPVQFLLDYTFAFAFVAFAGAFKNIIKIPALSFLCGGIIAGTGRYVMHLLSGSIFFGMYAPEGVNPWFYSAGYNSFVFVDIAIAIGVGCVLLFSKYLLNVMSGATVNMRTSSKRKRNEQIAQKTDADVEENEVK